MPAPTQTVAVTHNDPAVQFINARNEKTISLIHAIGQGVPTRNDNELIGINVNSPLTTLVIEDCELENLAEGIIAQSRSTNSPPIERVIVRRCYIHDIFDAGKGSELDTRAQGVYTYNVKEVIFEDCFIERIGYKTGVDPRDIYSHCIYVGAKCPRVTLIRCTLNDAAGQATKLEPNDKSETITVSMHSVICANSPISYNLTALADEPTDIWSVNVFEGRLTTAAPRGFDFYGDFPKQYRSKINVVRRNDPIDWHAVRNAPWGEWYHAAKASLVEFAGKHPELDLLIEPTWGSDDKPVPGPVVTPDPDVAAQLAGLVELAIQGVRARAELDHRLSVVEARLDTASVALNL